MKAKIFSFFALSMLSVSAVQAAVEITSPDTDLKLIVDDKDGQLTYDLNYKQKPVIVNAPLGLQTGLMDFTHNVQIVDSATSKIDKLYQQEKIKRLNNHYQANQLTLVLQNPEGYHMGVQWRLSNNNAALRYILPEQAERKADVVNYEITGFRFPERSTAFLAPQKPGASGWKRAAPSYEEYYQIEVPVGTPSTHGVGFTFPSLFHTPENIWALISETGVTGDYCASRLGEPEGGVYHVTYPQAEENNGNGSVSPGVSLPSATPWRTITVGNGLAPIVETTIAWDLVEPKYEIDFTPTMGKGTWSWILWQDESINYDDQVKYIDFAEKMGYNYVLIDCRWDERIGYDRMKELTEYANKKGVNPVLWYNSNGNWNDVEQTPINKMSRPIERKREMKRLADMGIKGIKVDFFAGDKQETMRLYEDILSDAADYGISVVFHGCTIPRGWERMYPNHVGSEAVMASETMYYQQKYCDEEAENATLHPFIRNSLGVMEYGGTFLNRKLSRDNVHGNTRRTGDAFQLANAVVYQNPIQFFALAPNNLEDAPAQAIDFLKQVPTTWEDIRFIDGYPGKYVVLARKNGDSWYVAALNGIQKTLKVTLPDWIPAGTSMLIDETPEKMVEKKLGKNHKITIPSNGGMVLVTAEK